MKKIGLVGGMTWNSTLEYYKLLNTIINKKLGSHHSCECIIYSVDFDEIEKLQKRGDWQEISSIICNTAEKLEKIGADMVLICSNMIHKIADDVEDDINIPLIRITDAVAVEIKKQGLKKVGLLGTKHTMEHSFFKDRVNKIYDIEIITPDNRDIIAINRIIFEELAKGKVLKESKNRFLEIIQKMRENGAEGIIMGCTEIPMMLDQADADIPLFDTVLIHVHKAVEFAVS